jgi:hypothetical protein
LVNLPPIEKSGTPNINIQPLNLFEDGKTEIVDVGAVVGLGVGRIVGI